MNPTINIVQAEALRDDIARLHNDLYGIDMYVGMGGMTVNAHDRLKAAIKVLSDAIMNCQED